MVSKLILIIKKRKILSTIMNFFFHKNELFENYLYVKLLKNNLIYKYVYGNN